MIDFLSKIYNYLLTLSINNIFYFIISSLILYGIFKLVMRLIHYLIFKKLINGIVEFVFEEDEEDSASTDDKFDREDSKLFEKNKTQELNQAAKLEQEQALNSAKNRTKSAAKIVGVKIPKAIGKFTAKIIESWVKNNINNVQDLQNMGYWQAMESNRIKQSMQQNGLQGGEKGLG